MQVLIAGSSLEEREQLTKHLVAERYTVTVANDAATALAEIDRSSPDIMVLDWALRGMPTAELLKEIRKGEREKHLYIVAIMSAPTPVAIGAAFAAGVDDVIRRPLAKEEIVARVGALGRIKHWSSRMVGLSGVMDWSGGTDFSTKRAWKEADLHINEDLMGMLGCTMDVTTDEPSPSFVAAAEIPLSLTDDGLEVRLRIALDGPSLAEIGKIIFGGEEMPADAMDDVVREFANTAGGSFKRIALEDGIRLTTGIPLTLPLVDCNAKVTSGLAREFLLAMPGSGVRIGARLVVVPRPLDRVTANKLREGMVLARDVRTEAGALLVASGTRLTEATVTRLARILPPTTLVQVAA
jgi:CheY-like chemotaxis protein